MKTRSVARLLYAHPVDMGGLPVLQPLPTQQVQQLDPFLLLHHANVKVPTYRDPMHGGVAPHPHRGFSPVTFVFQGGVHHRDSRGNNSVVYAGGAQWMNAGRGIIHSERPPTDIYDIGGRQEIIQLWINTPAKHKMDQPSYVAVQAESVPVYQSDDSNVTVRVFSGELLSLKGPVKPQIAVNSATAAVRQGGELSLSLPAHHTAFIYLLDGKLSVSGFGFVEDKHLVHFNQDGDGITLTALEDTRLLIMSGEPIGEPVVSHGPFVMNTQTQILEAMRDYQMGKMGVLIED